MFIPQTIVTKEGGNSVVRNIVVRNIVVGIFEPKSYPPSHLGGFRRNMFHENLMEIEKKTHSIAIFCLTHW